MGQSSLAAESGGLYQLLLPQQERPLPERGKTALCWEAPGGPSGLGIGFQGTLPIACLGQFPGEGSVRPSLSYPVPSLAALRDYPFPGQVSNGTLWCGVWGSWANAARCSDSAEILKGNRSRGVAGCTGTRHSGGKGKVSHLMGGRQTRHKVETGSLLATPV